MIGKYEAHITFPRKYDEVALKAIIRPHFAGEWKYSAFDADPVMGKEPYSYLTAYDTHEDRLLDRIMEVSLCARAANIPVLRKKVERIIYDTKTGVDEIGEPPWPSPY